MRGRSWALFGVSAGTPHWPYREPSGLCRVTRVISMAQETPQHIAHLRQVTAELDRLELRLAAGVRCGRKCVERLMRSAGLRGVYRRRRCCGLSS
jgi:hypothetical protein